MNIPVTLRPSSPTLGVRLLRPSALHGSWPVLNSWILEGNEMSAGFPIIYDCNDLSENRGEVLGTNYMLYVCRFMRTS